MQIRRFRRRGISPFIIMAGLSIGAMLLLPMLTGGDSPLSGIMEKVKGLFGGGEEKQEAAAGGATQEAESPYAPRPLPALPSLPSQQTPASSGDRFPVGQRGSVVRGMAAKPAESVVQAASGTGSPRPSGLEVVTSAKAYAPSGSSLAEVQRRRNRVFSEVEAAVQSGDRARIEKAYAALKEADERLAEAKGKAY